MIGRIDGIANGQSQPAREVGFRHRSVGRGPGKLLSLATLVPLVLFPLGARAQQQTALERPGGGSVAHMEQIVVTATKRDSVVQDVPFSVNVLSEAEIRRLNISSLEELSLHVPGLSIQNLGPGQSIINIRGVSSGQIVRDQPGVKEQLGIYLDETPISLSLLTPDIDLFDVSRVETLRGPQGTMFGAGSVGGTVRYITNPPVLNETEAKAEFDVHTIEDGSQGGRVKTALNAPLGEKAAVRLVTYGTRYGGFIDAGRRSCAVDNDVNDGYRYGARVAVLLKPHDKLSITPRIAGCRSTELQSMAAWTLSPHARMVFGAMCRPLRFRYWKNSTFDLMIRAAFIARLPARPKLSTICRDARRIGIPSGHCDPLRDCGQQQPGFAAESQAVGG